jgi:hypothetical protein
MYENRKMRPIETRMGGGDIKENDGGGWSQLWYIVRTFVNVTMYPYYNNNNNFFKKCKTRERNVPGANVHS